MTASDDVLGLFKRSTAISVAALGQSIATRPSLGGNRRESSSRVVERTSIPVGLRLPRDGDDRANLYGSRRVTDKRADVEVGSKRRV